METYEDNIRAECIDTLKNDLLSTTKDIIKIHGNDPDMGCIIASAYYSAIKELSKNKKYKNIAKTIFIMLRTTAL